MNRIVEEIETSADKAMADASFALSAGIAPMRSMPLFDAIEPAGMLTHADWLRGAVIARHPKGWRYEICEGIDGRGRLHLIGYDD